MTTACLTPEPFLLWNFITGCTPTNEYSVLGYHMITIGYIAFIVSGVMSAVVFCRVFYYIIIHMEDFVGGDKS